MSKSKWAVALIAFTIVPGLVWGADFLPKDKSQGGNVTVSGDTEYRNLYVGGGTVSINKRISGDLFAAGGSLNINSPVEEDLFTGGGNISITSAVGGDARIGGGNISLSAPIGGDLLVAGGTINMSPAATVGGDLWAAGGAINLNGNINGDLKVAGGEILINSEVLGDVEVFAEKLTFGPQSKVDGEITYKGQKEPVIQEGSAVSEVKFTKMDRGTKGANRGKAFGIALFVRTLAVFIAALVMLWLLGKTSNSLVTRIHGRPLANLGIGLLTLIATPIIAILLFVTILGSVLGGVVLVSFMLSCIVAMIYAVLLAGSLIERWAFKKSQVDMTWRTALWGAVVTLVLMIIPVIGWLANCVLFLMALGSIVQGLRSRLETKSEAPVEPIHQ